MRLYLFQFLHRLPFQSVKYFWDLGLVALFLAPEDSQCLPPPPNPLMKFAKVPTGEGKVSGKPGSFFNIGSGKSTVVSCILAMDSLLDYNHWLTFPPLFETQFGRNAKSEIFVRDILIVVSLVCTLQHSNFPPPFDAPSIPPNFPCP